MKHSCNNNLPQHSRQNMGTARKYLKPVMASMVAAVSVMATGAIIGYPSPAISNINAHHNSFSVTPEEMSWFGSLVFLAGIPGALISGWMMDRYGRKLTLMMGAVPFVVGFVAIAGAPNILVMYIGRILTGCCYSLMLSTAGVYISEISPPEIRGLLMSCYQVAFNIGAFLTYLIGAFVPWNWLAIFCASIPCLQVLLLHLLPESPRWLFFSGQPEEAIDCLIWLRGSSTDVQEEVQEIQQSLREAPQPLPWTDYFRPPLLKYFLVTQVVFMLAELSGVDAIQLYASSIFQASGTHLDSNLQSIIMEGVVVITSCFCTIIIDRFPRRILLASSTLTIGVGMAVMGVFFKVKEGNVAFVGTYLNWLPLLCLTVVTVGFTYGFGSLPFIVTSELFSTRARGRANSFGVTSVCICGFFVTKLFVNISDAIGQAGALWICALNCFVGAIFIVFTLPETKGKTLETIQQDLCQ